MKTDFARCVAGGLARCPMKVFGLIQHNIEMTFLLAPEWVPKDANLSVTLLMYQVIRSLQSGKKLPTIGKFQASPTPAVCVCVPGNLHLSAAHERSTHSG
jgi:hypothetical protein